MGEPHDSGDEIINFPVPKRYLPAVVRALAKAMENVDGVPLVQADEGVSPEEGPQQGKALIDWTNVESCKRFRRELHYPGALAMLDLTAANPTSFVSFQDVVRASGRTDIQVRAELGAMTKVIKRLYKVSREDVVWPAKFVWAAGGDQQAYYVMRPEVAQAWKQTKE